ncbi:cell division protein CdvB [Stygiolobus caldivivus]|uniref:Cell division protein n=1 Tax=Stygiolobus caldivivus TaxID=2824673 RepID=A0A8D5ZJ61_9CREN|nr:cell division protein CdvB [Stygiolobus caldivivus]BCU71234.1 cell division protein [Stygiolobus caldivivus]
MFDKFSSIFNSDRKRKIQLNKVITEISLKLKDQQDRLDEAIRRLKERDKELFEKVVRAQIEGDMARATIYAQEISDIRKMIKIIYTAYLAIEKVRLKLDTVQELQGVSLVLFPVMKILGELKDQIKGVAPEVALALDSITSSVNSIAIETGAISEKSVVPAIVDEQAKQILDEAQKMAEVKVREILPELPHPPSELPKPRAQAVQIKRSLTEQMLLDYIRSTGGFLDLEYLSKNYGVDKVEVLNLLKRLEQKGLIALEG